MKRPLAQCREREKAACSVSREREGRLLGVDTVSQASATSLCDIPDRIPIESPPLCSCACLTGDTPRRPSLPAKRATRSMPTGADGRCPWTGLRRWRRHRDGPGSRTGTMRYPSLLEHARRTETPFARPPPLTHEIRRSILERAAAARARQGAAAPGRAGGGPLIYGVCAASDRSV